MFRHAMVAALMLLMLAACGKDEPAPPADQATPPAEATVAEPAEEAAPAESPQEAQEVVEETAADTGGDQTITLAQADTPQPHEWKFKEGVNFTRLVPAQPTLGGADKIEVAEFFWYGCPHCYDFEPYINKWAKTKPANVRFVRIHAMWNQLLVMHARLFYTEQVLERNGIIKDPEAFRANVFAEYHRRNNRLASEDVIQKFFERNGVSADDFQRTWNSFEVDQKMRVAADLERRYSISSVPTIVVDGKYRTSAQEAGGVDELIELINELIARESPH
ncbi:MAG: thiol:disulfide interchange protein DsbA/DsbL [Woeseiaceae bacterium]